MKAANVYHNDRLAGKLIQHGRNSYEFRYEDSWFTNDALPAISLTLPKHQQVYFWLVVVFLQQIYLLCLMSLFLRNI